MDMTMRFGWNWDWIFKWVFHYYSFILERKGNVRETEETMWRKKIHVVLFFAFFRHKNLPQKWMYFFLYIDKNQALLMQQSTAICTKCTRKIMRFQEIFWIYIFSLSKFSSRSMQRFQRVFGSKLFSVIGMIHVRASPGSFNWAIRNDELTLNASFSGRNSNVCWPLQRNHWTGSARSEPLQKTQCRKWRTVFNVSKLVNNIAMIWYCVCYD